LPRHRLVDVQDRLQTEKITAHISVALKQPGRRLRYVLN
jgi:hypothetical protein